MELKLGGLERVSGGSRRESLGAISPLLTRARRLDMANGGAEPGETLSQESQVLAPHRLNTNPR